MTDTQTTTPVITPKNTTSKYATLLETNEEEMESWYYFIKYDGNEENLKHLQEQLNQVRFKIINGLSTFDLELEYLVSAQTAKEMTKIDMNAFSFHRKFDGTLKKIDFKLKSTDKNSKKIEKCYEVLGLGSIEDYISDEDIDPEDLVTNSDDSDDDSDEDSDEDSDDDTDDDSDEDSDEDSDDSETTETDSSESETGKSPKKGVPQTLVKTSIPRWAKARKKKNHVPLKKV